MIRTIGILGLVSVLLGCRQENTRINSSDNTLIKCAIHGEKPSAIVCRHHLQETNYPIGFIENSSVPGDHQAWCDDCEAFFLKEKELSEAFKQFNQFAVVCEDCYLQTKARNSKKK